DTRPPIAFVACIRCDILRCGHHIRPKVRMRRPIRLPHLEGLPTQQQVHRLRQPLLYHRTRFLVRIAEKPPAMLESVALILVLYITVERHKFTSGYLSHSPSPLCVESSSSSSARWPIVIVIPSLKPISL